MLELDIEDILSTERMFDQNKLDVRTITMGISLLGVTEMLKDLTVFIGNCNFHNGISFASFA